MYSDIAHIHEYNKHWQLINKNDFKNNRQKM